MKLISLMLTPNSSRNMHQSSLSSRLQLTMLSRAHSYSNCSQKSTGWLRKTGPLCFRAGNFRSIDLIGTEFGTNERCFILNVASYFISIKLGKQSGAIYIWNTKTSSSATVCSPLLSHVAIFGVFTDAEVHLHCPNSTCAFLPKNIRFFCMISIE